MEIPGKLLTPT